MTPETSDMKSLVGGRVTISIDEPSSYAEHDESEVSGRLVRVLSGGGQSASKYDFAVVELDEPLKWQERDVQVVSIMPRHSGHRLAELQTTAGLGVNLNREPEWILDCPEDDPRLRRAEDSAYIGFGVAKMKP